MRAMSNIGEFFYSFLAGELIEYTIDDITIGDAEDKPIDILGIPTKSARVTLYTVYLKRPGEDSVPFPTFGTDDGFLSQHEGYSLDAHMLILAGNVGKTVSIREPLDPNDTLYFIVQKLSIVTAETHTKV